MVQIKINKTENVYPHLSLPWLAITRFISYSTRFYFSKTNIHENKNKNFIISKTHNKKEKKEKLCISKIQNKNEMKEINFGIKIKIL